MRYKLLILFLVLTSLCAKAATISGSCGTNAQWTYDTETGHLSITGTGAMNNFSSSNQPWKDYRSSIKTVSIANGITHIGDYAFNECSSLTSIDILESVTSIGICVFTHSDLNSVFIPKSVISIDILSFYECLNLSSIIVDNGNPKYDSRENCNAIIETETNEIIRGCKNSVIPNTVTSIGNYAFVACMGLTSITIPNSVTNIGDRAFGGCWDLTTITIPNSVTEIKQETFVNCKSLTSVTIPESVTRIWFFAFDGCSSLTSVTNLAATPQKLYNGTFSQYGTLHVRPGCGDAYRVADYWKNFNIVEDAMLSIDIVDGEEIENKLDKEYDKITYTRNFSNTNWQALYVPFAMSYEDWGEDFEVARINAVCGNNDVTGLTLTKVNYGSIEPNTPCLIRAKQPVEKCFTLTNTTLFKTEEKSISYTYQENKYAITGTYHTIAGSEMVAEGYFALGAGSLHQAADDSNNLKSMRWYLDITDGNGNKVSPENARMLVLQFTDDEITGIDNIDADGNNGSDVVYDLRGRKVTTSTLKFGIYVKNGKKVMIE